VFDRAYLDIETSYAGEITVVGICLLPDDIVQLVGDEITGANLMDALAPASVIVTYNGNRFDLPMIKRAIGLDLRARFTSHDLMYDCWRRGLYGGLKGVERQLGITRETDGITGRDAPILWDRYVSGDDQDALNLLLCYNRDDVVNLVFLERRLGDFANRSTHIRYPGRA
jgi:uncharacterized protein YprB with RNaseH-like and TPR domain